MARSPLAVNKFRLLFFIWWLVWACLHSMVIGNIGFDRNTAILDSACSNLFLLGACWLIATIFNFYLPKADRPWNFFFICLLGTALVLLSTRYCLSQVFAGDAAYLAFLSKSMIIRSCFDFLLFSTMVILCVWWYTVEEETEVRQRILDSEKLAREAELYKLRQQLHPHFLFNSLNSISALAGSDPQQARKMIQQLADFLRGTLKREDQQVVSLSEELQLLQLYLDIEKIRFGYRLTTKLDYTQAAGEAKMPPMLLQPIVENAIKYGLYETTGEVVITINAAVSDHELLIRVENPFDPTETVHQNGTGFGLRSLGRRLYLIFGRHDLLVTKTANCLFTTTLKVPQWI